MKKHAILGWLVGAVALQGCTHLDASKVDGGLMKAEGAPYNLTFTQYELTVKRRISSCFDEPDPPLPPGVAASNPTPNMKVTTTVEATRKEARDPSQEYVIDFAALRSFFKTTDVAVEYYDTGALKSVNATVTDKTGEFLKSTFTAAAKIAMLGTGVGGDGSEAPEGCKPKVAKALVDATQGERDVKALTAELARQTELLEKLQAVAVALGPTRSAAERKEFSDQIIKLYQLKNDLTKKQTALADNLKTLTISTAKKTWPTDGATFSGQIVPPLTNKDIAKWGSIGEKGAKELKESTGVWVLISSTSPSANHVVCEGVLCTSQTPIAETKGLKYRLAMPGQLQACSNKTCAGDEVELFNDSGMFSQLGPIMTLPLRNYPFMTQTVVLTMNEAGQPTKIGYKSEAGADKAMDTVNTFVDEYGKVRQAKKPKSELDLVKDETALLEAKAKLAAAKSALDLSPNATQTTATEALKADTALLEAELAKLKAQAALDEARKQGST